MDLMLIEQFQVSIGNLEDPPTQPADQRLGRQ
jgi:hypothetical protein